MKKEHYTEKQLLKFAIKDLISDIRFTNKRFPAGSARPADEIAYQCECLSKVFSLFANRNGKLRFDKYGYPL